MNLLCKACSVSSFAKVILILLILPTALSVMPTDQSQSVLKFSDINDFYLQTQISKFMGIDYLAVTNATDLGTEIEGKIWGKHQRLMISLPVKISHKKCDTIRWVHFIIDTGSPITVLSKHTIQTFWTQCQSRIKTLPSRYFFNLNDRKVEIEESRSYYGESNIIGTDYLTANNIGLQIIYSSNKKGIIKMKYDVGGKLEGDEDL